jgi:tetratricopeptide (TPR) repeat protein
MPPENAHDPDAQQPQSGLRRRWRRLAAGGRVVVAWSTANRLRAGLLLGGCLASVAGVAFGWLLLVGRGPLGEPVTLEMALEALDNGSYGEARSLAAKLEAQDTLPVEELGGPVFVLGAAAAYEADDTWSKDTANYYLAAARYLEEARDRGFPPGRESEGLYLLGRSLYQSGQIPASRPVLLEALKVNQYKRTEIHHLLAGAYLSDANPQLQQALAENALYLADRRLPRAARHEGLLQQAQILLRLEKIAQCMAALEKIPSDATNRAEAIIMRGRVLMHQARALKNKPEATAEDKLQAQDTYQTAIKTLRLAQGRDTLSNQATRQSMYLIGNCFLEMGDDRATLGQFAQIYNLYPDSPEALAASFQEAELARRRGHHKNALTCYRRVLRAVTDPEDFSNPWITLDQLRSQILRTYEDYLHARNFEIGLQLVRHFYPLFSRVGTLELMAETYCAWGDALLTQAAELPPGKAEATRRLGRVQLRHAGRVYWRLAGLLVTTRQYPDQLWNGANAYLRGQDYDQAVHLFQEYVRNESRRQPLALVHLGEALLSLGRIDEALEAFRQCIEFHSRDAAAFRARLLASNAYLEKGDLAQAETLLRDNLSEQYQTPASSEWRDSLFALGELLHIQDRYAEALRCLEEAVQRYPDASQTLAAQYLIADSYRRSAEVAREKLIKELKGTTQVAHSRQIDEFLIKALGGYRQIQEVLSKRREAGELLPLEEAILRNCYFAVGDVLFALRRHEAAVEAYRTATNRYQNHPEVLEAYVRMACAYRRLNKPLQARSTLEQAKVMLARMKNDAQFQETTNYTRSQWGERLDWLSSL